MKSLISVLVGTALVCLWTCIVWFTVKPLLDKESTVPTKVQNTQKLEVSYPNVNIEVCHARKVTDKESQKTAIANNQTVWSTRTAKLRAGCDLAQAQTAKSEQKGWRSKLINRLIVSDRYKFLVCVVPTVASTSIYKILSRLERKTVTTKNAIDKTVERNANDFFKHLGTYSQKQIKFRLHNYRKVIFVREPMERLLSAYRTRFGDTLSTENILSFADFLQFVQGLTVENDSWFDIHWRRVFDFCFPCQMSYDTIVKYESLHEDMSRFLREVGADDAVKLPERLTLYHHPNSSDVVWDYYKQIPFAQIKSLWNFYNVDAALFGYEFPQRLCK